MKIASRLLLIALLFAGGTGLGAGAQEKAEAAAAEDTPSETAREPEALPPVRFVPTETISADTAISFPIDI